MPRFYKSFSQQTAFYHPNEMKTIYYFVSLLALFALTNKYVRSLMYWGSSQGVRGVGSEASPNNTFSSIKTESVHIKKPEVKKVVGSEASLNNTFPSIKTESEHIKKPEVKKVVGSEASLNKTFSSIETESEHIKKTKVKKVVDFAIIGFPKCSTTFLRNSLINTPQIFYGNDDSEIHLNEFKNKKEFVKLYENVSDPEIKKGFKCPEVLYSKSTLSIIENHFPSTDFIVSVRNPVLWFQTFYNYRLRRGNNMPHPNDLIGKCASKGRIKGEGVLDQTNRNRVYDSHKVCTDRANFHLALSRLGKTPMNTEEEMGLLHNHNLSVHRFPNRVFLMELGQLSVENRTRSDLFVEDLGSFLHLNSVEDQISSHALPRLEPHVATHNVATTVNGTRLNEKLLDICSPSHDALRSILLKTGRDASHWIMKYFINSPDVIVSDREHFLTLMKTWEDDPCTQK